MPNYRIYRMKDTPRQHFRWAPHLSGAANVKRRDYEESGQIEAASEYAAWDELRSSRQPLEIGDLLEIDNGELRICKYIGFESAAWILPPGDPGAPQENPAQENLARQAEAPGVGESHA